MAVNLRTYDLNNTTFESHKQYLFTQKLVKCNKHPYYVFLKRTICNYIKSEVPQRILDKMKYIIIFIAKHQVFFKLFFHHLTIMKINIKVAIMEGKILVVNKRENRKYFDALAVTELFKYIETINRKNNSDTEQDIYIVSDFKKNIYFQLMVIHAIDSLLKNSNITLKILVKKIDDIESLIKFLNTLRYPRTINIKIKYSSKLEKLPLNFLIYGDTVKFRRTDYACNKLDQVVIHTKTPNKVKINALSKELFDAAEYTYENQHKEFVKKDSTDFDNINNSINEIIKYEKDNYNMVYQKSYLSEGYPPYKFIKDDDFNWIT